MADRFYVFQAGHKLVIDLSKAISGLRIFSFKISPGISAWCNNFSLFPRPGFLSFLHCVHQFTKKYSSSFHHSNFFLKVSTAMTFFERHFAVTGKLRSPFVHNYSAPFFSVYFAMPLISPSLRQSMFQGYFNSFSIDSNAGRIFSLSSLRP
jgi:hypothetical protein